MMAISRIEKTGHIVERNKKLKTQHDTFIEDEHKQSKEPFDFEKFTKNY